MTDITQFKAIFSGLDIAYGTYKIKSERGDGKQNPAPEHSLRGARKTHRGSLLNHPD